MCSGSAWSQATTPSREKTQGKLAVPVRTFIRKNGALFQPIDITLGIFPHPQPTSRSRRQNPKNIFAIREWKCAQSGSKTRDHPIYGPPHPRAQRQYPRLSARKAPHASADPGACADPAPTPPRATHRLRRGPRATTECAECVHFSKTFLDPSAPIPPAHPRRTGQPAARRASRGPISSGGRSRHLTNC